MIKRTLQAICEVFDCSIIWDAPDPEDPYWEQTCMLGSWGDRSVGIDSFFLTDGFEAEDGLRTFVESEAGWKHINEEASSIFAEWDSEREGWTYETFPAFHECLWVGEKEDKE